MNMRSKKRSIPDIFLCSLGQFCWPLPGHLFWPLTQDLVFTKEDGNPVPKYYIQRVFKQASAKAGVGPYRLHDLRHTFNTNMLKAGVDKTITMKLTGHKTNAMFLRYSHIDNEMGELAMGTLSSFLGIRNIVALNLLEDGVYCLCTP